MKLALYAYGSRSIKTAFCKMLLLGLLGMISWLAFPPTLFAVQDDDSKTDAATTLREAMLHAIKNDPGRLLEYQERIADLFCEAAEKGVEMELLETFGPMWTGLRKNDPASNPRFVTLPAESKRKILAAALRILDRYLTKLQEIESRSKQSFKLFDPLGQLVLPPDETTTVVIGWYKDCGGQGGFYRTFVDYLVQRAVAEKRLDDLATAVKQRRDQITTKQKEAKDLTDREKRSLKVSALKCDMIDMQIALRQKNLKQMAMLKKRFSDAIKTNEPPGDSVKNWIILALVPAYDNADLFTQVDDLLEEAMLTLDAANQSPRYYYYLMPQILPMALKHSDLNRAVAMADIYRKFSEKRLSKKRYLNHLLFAANDQIYRRAMATKSPAELVMVLDFFGKFPVDYARRPNLLPLLDRLESLAGNLSTSDREKLLGNLDLAAIRRVETSRKIPKPREPLVAKGSDLPKLPAGKPFFSDNFDHTPHPGWSSDRRDISANGIATFLGGFTHEKLQLRLDDLPPHKLVRVRFDLILPGTPDGLMGLKTTDKENSFGPDYWELYTKDQLRLIATTFANFNKDPYAQKQSYPDDFPIAFGVKPAWYDHFLSINGQSLWNDEFDTGYYEGRTGAAATRSLGIERSATYAIDLIFPHDDKTLELNFRDDFRDGSYSKNTLESEISENWALDNVRIELIDRFWNAKPEELLQCIKMLFSDDPIAANAARWRLAAAGDKTVEQLESFSQTAKGKALATNPESFFRFRTERLLDIIGSDQAKKLQKKWFGPNSAWKNATLPHDFWQSKE